MTKLIGSIVPIGNKIGVVLQGLGFDLLPVEGDQIAAGEILVAESVADQDPSGLDNPLQVEFGPAQSTDSVDVAADGTWTVKEKGVYLIFSTYYFSRTSSTGQVHFFIRLLVDGVQEGNPIGIIQTDDDVTTPIFLSTVVSVSGTVPIDFTVECVRDADGVNSGGLRSIESSIGWGQTPSARLRIIKL
jgi:hypothetical protein